MSFCLVCFLPRRFHPSPGQRTSSMQQKIVLPDLAAELEDSRKFSLASLTTLLAMLTLSRSIALQPAVITFFMYTITLRLALDTCFLQEYPTVSRFLHVVPLIGITCVACVELLSNVQSPALAALCILSGVLPLVVMTIHHGRQCTDPEMSAAVLPIRVEHMEALGV